MSGSVPKFSDFAADEERPLEGEKVRLDSILNKPVVLCAFRVRNSKYKKDGCDRCATVQFYEAADTRKRIFFTGSGVIIGMLEKYGDRLPFETVIKKIDRYYSLT